MPDKREQEISVTTCTKNNIIIAIYPIVKWFQLPTAF